MRENNPAVFHSLKLGCVLAIREKQDGECAYPPSAFERANSYIAHILHMRRDIPHIPERICHRRPLRSP